MTIAQMSHFYALCQSGSYTQAAKQLYITQPALSKSISALESELNLRLVERSTRTVALTAAGEEFARACEEMLEVYRKGVNNARTAAGDISGLVRFGLPRDRVCDTFAGLRRHIEEEYPNLRLELRFYSENGLLRALDDHMADFVLAFGRPRADSSLLSCKLKRELGIEPLPHLACRDRNLSATRALLLGLSMEGIRNVLLVTGDPVAGGQEDMVKGVFHFNARKLASYVAAMNDTVFPNPMRAYGALNVNAKNFQIQLKLAQEKEANGICAFLTQPVHSQEALENLKLARQTLHGKILGGVLPIVSYRNACFLNNEIAGVFVCEQILAQYQDKDRTQGEALAVEISCAIGEAMAPYTDGLYLMTPFNRISLMETIMERLG